jgi:hypothetical protein
MAPENFFVRSIDSRSAREFKRDVFPAPDAPIMNKVYPGSATPEQFLSTYNGFVLSAPSFFSALVVFTCTV